MKHLLYFVVTAIVVCLGTANLSSCKKYADNPPYFQPYDSAGIPDDRRVLVIAIDGLQSDAFKAAATTNYTAMMANAKYSWDAKSDIISTDASAWKTLTSGVSYGSHQISDSSFLPAIGDNSGDIEHGGSTVQNYPSFFYFITRSRLYNTNTVMLSSWANMVNKTANEAKLKEVLGNDVEVRDSAVTQLKNANPRVMVLHFNGPAKTASDPGSAASFSAGSADYTDALKKVDGYIGDIMTALKARPAYGTTENWLVVVTGTHGGINKTYGGASDAEINVPTLYYNKKFVKQEFTKEGAYSAVNFNMNSSIAASVADPGGVFNPGTSKQMTIQFKFKGAATYWPHVFSKWTGRWSAGSGWSIYRNNDESWGFTFRSTTSGERRLQPDSPPVFDNKWHLLTFTFYDSIGRRWIKRFTDGTRLPDDDGTREITGFGDISSDAPLTIGVPVDPWYTNAAFNIADVSVFNKALDDTTVANNLCLKDYTQHSQFANLTDFWPCNDAGGSQLINKVNTGRNFRLSGPFKWSLLTEYPCNYSPVTPAGKTTLFLQNADISAQIFYWLQLPVPTSWALEGNIWLTGFEKEFIKY